MKPLYLQLLLVATLVGSLPSVAAETKYRTTFQTDGSAALEGEIIYSPTENGAGVFARATVSLAGRPTEVSSILNKVWQSEPELAAANLDGCTARGGARVNITVKAGTFDACKIQAITSDVELITWTGGVAPFGVIRKIFKKDGVRTSEELVEYAP